MVTTTAPAIIRYSCSTNSAIWNVTRFVPPTCTTPTAARLRRCAQAGHRPVSRQGLAHLLAKPGPADQDCLSAQAPSRGAAQRGAAITRASPTRRQAGASRAGWSPRSSCIPRRLHRDNMSRPAEQVVAFHKPPGSGSRKARDRSSGRDYHAGRSPPTRCGCSLMRSPTTSVTSCVHWRRPSRSRTGRCRAFGRTVTFQMAEIAPPGRCSKKFCG